MKKKQVNTSKTGFIIIIALNKGPYNKNKPQKA